jgi:hypothetical protein
VTYPNSHMYVSILGDAYQGTEHWQFGLRLSDGGASNQATADAIGGQIATWYASGPSNFIDNHRLTSVKVARVEMDGLYTPNTIAGEYFPASPVPGSIAYAAFPGTMPQGTLVVTLTTAVPRGYASKGRLFPPPQALPIQVNGLVAADTATNDAQQFKSLIDVLNANALVGNVIVASKGKGHFTLDAKGKKHWTYPDPGAQHNVTGLRVGRVMDTQRRRRRQLIEQPVSVVIA